jgi:hypothetical protein
MSGGKRVIASRFHEARILCREVQATVGAETGCVAQVSLKPALQRRVTETSRAQIHEWSDSPGVMNANPIQLPARRQAWPVKALAIWLIDACAIVVLAVVMSVVNEFKDQPGKAASK